MPGFTKSSKRAKSTVYQPLEPTTHPWQPEWRRAPLWGLARLFVAFVGAVVAVFILTFSDGKPIHGWKFQPTVYLATASTVTNIALAFALFEGIAIAWWQKALQEGTTITDLHRIWEYGTSFKAAILSGSHVNLVVVASILVALTPINGPLLQRASTFQPDQISVPTSLDLQVSTLIPKGWTGIVSSRGDDINGLRQNFFITAREFYSNSPINLTATCKGQCEAKAIGAGFHVSCTSQELPLEVPTQGTWKEGSEPGIVFYTGVDYTAYAPTRGNLTTVFKASNGCTDPLQVRNCTLTAGTVQYPVLVDGPSNSIQLAPQTSIWDDVIIGTPDYLPSETHMSGQTSTYGGLFLVLSNRWSSDIISVTTQSNLLPTTFLCLISAA